PRPAVGAVAAADGRGNHHPVADAEIAHRLPDLLDDTHAFVAEDGSRLHSRHGAADHVEVGAADRARRETDDGVGRLLDLRLLHVLEAHVAHAVEHDRFHDVSFGKSARETVATARMTRNSDLRAGTAEVRGDGRSTGYSGPSAEREARPVRRLARCSGRFSASAIST